MKRNGTIALPDAALAATGVAAMGQAMVVRARIVGDRCGSRAADRHQAGIGHEETVAMSNSRSFERL
jgi:hypothetical protein